MGWFLLAHIGLPLFFGTAFVIFSAAVSPTTSGWDVLVETAQDLTILSLGATGAIFDNARVEQAFGSNSALVAIGVIAVNLIFSAIIVFARAKATKLEKHFSFYGGIMVLFLGFLTLALPLGFSFGRIYVGVDHDLLHEVSGGVNWKRSGLYHAFGGVCAPFSLDDQASDIPFGEVRVRL